MNIPLGRLHAGIATCSDCMRELSCSGMALTTASITTTSTSSTSTATIPFSTRQGCAKECSAILFISVERLLDIKRPVQLAQSWPCTIRHKSDRLIINASIAHLQPPLPAADIISCDKKEAGGHMISDKKWRPFLDFKLLTISSGSGAMTTREV